MQTALLKLLRITTQTRRQRELCQATCLPSRIPAQIAVTAFAESPGSRTDRLPDLSPHQVVLSSIY